MKKIIIIILLLLILPLNAFCANYTVIHKYPDGGLLQIDRLSIRTKFGYLVNLNYDDFEHVLSCSDAQQAKNLAEVGCLRSNQCGYWYFVNAKIRGEDIKLVFGEGKYSIYDIKTKQTSEFFDVKLNTPAHLIQSYISTFKGRRMLKKTGERGD